MKNVKISSHQKRTALFWAFTQRVVVIPCRNFGTTYRSHLQGPRIFDSCPLKMEQTGCPETSVRNYHYTLRNSPEVHGSYLFRGGSLKFCSLHKAVLKPMATKVRVVYSKNAAFISIFNESWFPKKNILRFPLSLSYLLLKAQVVMGCVF